MAGGADSATPWSTPAIAACVGAWLLLWPIASCGGDDGEVRRLAQLAAPHVADFVRFEQWVHRAHQGAFDPHDGAALEEAVFAPIRHDAGVLAAMVVHEGRDARRWVFPEQASFPYPLHGTRVRPPSGGVFEVADWAQCPLELPSWWRKGVSRRCVLLVRTAPLSVGETLTVVVAFTAGP